MSKKKFNVVGKVSENEGFGGLPQLLAYARNASGVVIVQRS